MQALRIATAVLTATVALAADGSPAASGAAFLASRIKVLQLEQVTRFNYMDRGPGLVTDRDIQYRIRARVQVDLAGDGTTYLRLRAETGRGFDNSWDNTGLGKGEGRWNFNVKSFALGQKLGSHLELQAGGIEFEQGAGSQRTYASGDGHLVGYRAIWNRPASSWRPDRLSLTMGYAGDFGQPSVFSRFHLGKLNYTQLLAEKSIGRDIDASAQVDSIRDIWFTRQALRWRNPWRPVLSEATVETVTRTTDNPTFGWSASLARPLDSSEHWHVHAIYTHIPQTLYTKGGVPVLFNQGEIDCGKRIAWGASYAISQNFEIGVFGGRLLDATPSKRWIAQVFVSYQYAHLINRLFQLAGGGERPNLPTRR